MEKGEGEKKMRRGEMGEGGRKEAKRRKIRRGRMKKEERKRGRSEEEGEGKEEEEGAKMHEQPMNRIS